MTTTHSTGCCKKTDKMILYGDALGLIERVGQQNSGRVDEVDLISARGRILAQDVLSPEVVPSFDNSAMDGFAVFTQDLENAGPQTPVVLPVAHRVVAGDLAALDLAAHLGPGRAIEIMTGAPLPRNGCDAVVRFEDTHPLEGGARVEFRSPIKRGANIRLAGSDIEKGQILARAGKRLGPSEILAFAGVGRARVLVRRRPKIAILSTGAELVPFTQKNLPLGLIRNSTAPFLIAALEEMGFRADYLGIQGDDAKAYRQSIEKALLEGADLILSTGAVSMGKVDFVPEVLSDLKAKVHFHKAAIRPGKPIFFAELGGSLSDLYGSSQSCAFFGMPGNPISTVVALRFFVEPYLRSLLGQSPEKPKSAKLLGPVTKPKGLRSFLKGHVSRSERGELRVQVLKDQSSYGVAALGESNSWVVIDEDRDGQSTEDEVTVVPLANGFADWI